MLSRSLIEVDVLKENTGDEEDGGEGGSTRELQLFIVAQRELSREPEANGVPLWGSPSGEESAKTLGFLVA